MHYIRYNVSMKVSVVIPTYNEEKYIEDCLKSLLNQVEPADEIIIVDNNCTDKTIEIAQKYPVRIIKETTQGMIPARNKGLDSAKFPLILRTDADARVPKDWVKQIKKHFLGDSELLALSGSYLFYETPRRHNKQVEKLFKSFYFYSLKQLLGHDALMGPNMAIKKSVWAEVRNEVCLRDDLVHEDIDLAIHIGRFGKVSYDPKIVVPVSFRRWRKIKPYVDYPYRYFRTIQVHKLSLSKGKILVKKARHFFQQTV